MKITNKTLGKFIVILLIVIPWIIEEYIDIESDLAIHFLAVGLILSIFIVITYIVIGVIKLLNEDMWEIHIPTPFTLIKEYLKAKKEKEEKKARLYNSLFYAKTPEEVDLINKKLENLK